MLAVHQQRLAQCGPSGEVPVNIVVLQGVLSSAPSSRELPSGSVLVTYEVTTPVEGAAAASVPVVWFDPPEAGTTLEPGTEVVVTGRVRRRFFSAGGSTASRTEVLADAVVPVGHARRVDTAVRRSLERAQALLVPS